MYATHKYNLTNSKIVERLLLHLTLLLILAYSVLYISNKSFNKYYDIDYHVDK